MGMGKHRGESDGSEITEKKAALGIEKDALGNDHLVVRVGGVGIHLGRLTPATILLGPGGKLPYRKLGPHP